MEYGNPSEPIMAALATLQPHHLSQLTQSLYSDFRRQRHHLCSLLRHPARFDRALHHLETLSFHQKTNLIARHLLSSLKQLTTFWETQPPNIFDSIRCQDLDALLLLMLLCEFRQHDSQALETRPANWREILNDYVADKTLTMTLSGIGATCSAILNSYIDTLTRCRTFLDSTDCSGGERETEVAASAAVVVALPSVEIRGFSVECVICREEMKEGRDVCKLPCDHLFHWMCILPWLRKRSTCPCCRFRLPTDDVFGEIQRLWGVLVQMGTRSVGRDSCVSAI